MSESERKRKQRRFDGWKTTIRRLEGIFEMVILTVVYYFIWAYDYRIDFPERLVEREQILLAGLYFVILFVVFKLSDCFKIGKHKLSELFISQAISILIVNGITYFQLCLVYARIINVLPILSIVVSDIILAFFMLWIFDYIYFKNNVVKNMLLICNSDNSSLLERKINKHGNKYHIDKIINAEMPKDVIISEIDCHDAVILNDVSAENRNDILKYCYRTEKSIYVVPKVSDVILNSADNISLIDTPMYLVRGRGLTYIQKIQKRILDLVLCIIALVPCIPVMLVVSLLIKLEDGGPVFYKQKRETIGRKEFNILKFRSMIVDAENGGYNLNMRAGERDPRITKTGNIIRKLRIDELPQLLNILRGDMSIVGPRPERIENMEEYCREMPEFDLRTKVKGGLTGYAQIYGKYNTSPFDKLKLDLMYIEKYSIFLDIKLIFMTLQILVKPESTEGFENINNSEDESELKCM